MKGKLIYFLKNLGIEHEAVIVNRDTVALLNKGTNAACFHRVGK
jgi:hypothetical protein